MPHFLIIYSVPCQTGLHLISHMKLGFRNVLVGWLEIKGALKVSQNMQVALYIKMDVHMQHIPQDIF